MVNNQLFPFLKGFAVSFYMIGNGIPLCFSLLVGQNKECEDVILHIGKLRWEFHYFLAYSRVNLLGVSNITVKTSAKAYNCVCLRNVFTVYTVLCICLISLVELSHVGIKEQD